MVIDRKKKAIWSLCLIFGLWHFGTNWTTTLLAFLQWDTVQVLTIVDIGYIQAFGSFCNAVGALAIGQMTDSMEPKTMFIISIVLTSLYYIGLGIGRSWLAFFVLQILRVGYQLDATIEMYLATLTTERERTAALMMLTIPQAITMFFAPLVASKIAVYSSLRMSQIINGIAVAVIMIPVVYLLLPTTHSIPKLASTRLRPQEYLKMIKKNKGLCEGLILRGLLITAYVCYELIARNFLLRAYMKGTGDSAEVVATMGFSLIVVQFIILPFLQKHFNPKTLLQLTIATLIICYGAVTFTTSLIQLLIITAIQTSAYAIAYAESSTQITSSVEIVDLGKATGLASMMQWISHFIVPIYTSHLANKWHYTYAFYTSSIIMAITFIFISIFAKNTNARLRTLLPSLTVT